MAWVVVVVGGGAVDTTTTHHRSEWGIRGSCTSPTGVNGDFPGVNTRAIITGEETAGGLSSRAYPDLPIVNSHNPAWPGMSFDHLCLHHRLQIHSLPVARRILKEGFERRGICQKLSRRLGSFPG